MRRKRTRIIIKENNKNEKKEKHTKYTNKKRNKWRRPNRLRRDLCLK
jgi:hypothetical protein